MTSSTARILLGVAFCLQLQVGYGQRRHLDSTCAEGGSPPVCGGAGIDHQHPLFNFPTFGEGRDPSRKDFTNKLEELKNLAAAAAAQATEPPAPIFGELDVKNLVEGVMAGVIAQFGGCNLPPDQIIPLVINQLKGLLPPECGGFHPIKDYADLEWSFNYAGMVVGSMALIYASPVEYILVFGSPIPAQGFSGRYKDFFVTDTMIQGKLADYYPGQFTPTVVECGQSTILTPNTATGYSIGYDGGPSWMIEYGRGDILAALDYGITFPTYFTTLDFQSALTTLEDQLLLNLEFINWATCLAQQQGGGVGGP